MFAIDIPDIPTAIGGFFKASVILALVLWFINQLQRVWDRRRSAILQRNKAAFSQHFLRALPVTALARVSATLRRFYPFLNKRSNPVNYDYFNNTVGRFFSDNAMFGRNESRFLIAARKDWLLSCNPKFSVTASLDEGLATVSPTKRIVRAAQRFSLSVGEHDFSDVVRRLKPGSLWNDPTFAVNKCSWKDNNLQLAFQIGEYFDFIRINEALNQETLFYYSNPLKRKMIREAFKVKRVQDAFRFDLRPTLLGINVFTIFNKGTVEGRPAFCTFIQRRNLDVVENPGLYNVVPTGAHQPLPAFLKQDIARQCFISFTVLREALEEIYNVAEAEDDHSGSPYEIFAAFSRDKHDQPTSCKPGSMFGSEPREWFAGKNHLPYYAKKWEVTPTAFFVNLLTMKPELSVVLYIRDPEAYSTTKDFFRANWEAMVQEYELWPDSTSLKTEIIIPHFNAKQFLGPGAIALAEGIDYFARCILPNGF